MRLAISPITAASLGAENYLPCPWGITWRCHPRKTFQPAGDAVFSRQGIIRAELWYDVLVTTPSSCSPCSFPSLSLFACCNSTEQPSPPCGKSSHSPAALPCTCACLHPFFRLMAAAEGLPAAFQGVNASLPMGQFSVDTGWAWVVSPKQDEVLPHCGIN